MRMRTAFWLVLSGLVVSREVAAQSLEPRAYTNVPVGMNFLIVGDTYSTGGLATDPDLPVKDANLRVHAPVLAYARSLDVWGKSAKFDAIVVVRQGVVLFRNYGGAPNNERTERQINPLGPLQGVGDSVAGGLLR